MHEKSKADCAVYFLPHEMLCDDPLAFVAHELVETLCLEVRVAVVADSAAHMAYEAEVGQLFTTLGARKAPGVPVVVHCLYHAPDDKLVCNGRISE